MTLMETVRTGALLVLLATTSFADEARDGYAKREVMIPMRDGVRLFTAIYEPRDRAGPVPIMLIRTPYSCRPYGPDEYRSSLGPNKEFQDRGYVFVYQDVRGCYLSEGTFVNMRPHVPRKTSRAQVDESSDTYDTIEWLLANLGSHNGRVGQWGISYPGFYAAAGMIDAHPALKAVSPQAPIADWYFDDFHHHGALFLPHAFNFLSSFGQRREEPKTSRNRRFDHGTQDGYAFFLEMGPVANAESRHLLGTIPFWTELAAHPDRDAFWKARDIVPHLEDCAPAVLTVGGWFDAEDLYGPLAIYRSVEAKNPGIFNALVMGPWAHGGWSRSPGDSLGLAWFDGKQSEFYREQIELPFFEHWLRDGPAPEIAEANVFETGANRWRSFDAWPPRGSRTEDLHLLAGGRLSFEAPSADDEGRDTFISDPARPVPYSEKITKGMSREYMTDDQRFAARRPDVLTYRSEPLLEDVTLAGPILAELTVSTTGADADWVVKLIDEYPPDARAPEGHEVSTKWSGAMMMVRSEAFRGRYREAYDAPVPFIPREPTRVAVPLQDVLHTFRVGHRVVVQVQSTWFPLIDRNPQAWVPNIFEAEEHDYVAQRHDVWCGASRGSRLAVRVLSRTRDE